MEHLLVLCLCGFPLFLPVSSNFCGLQYLESGLDKADNVSSKYSNALETPWLVNIYGNGQRCQGIILSSWWVLTAANCFLLMNPSQVELTGSPGHISTKTVRQFLLHRGFSAGNTAPNNDLGLIVLDQPVDLNVEDMWLACIPLQEKPYDTQEECRIIERGQEGSMKFFPKATTVKALSISDCSKHWPDTKELRTLCVARKDTSKQKDCKVSVGSPVICHDPFTQDWEVMGIVSQSLLNCNTPILASQVLSHLQWLKQVGAIQNPLQPEEAREEPAEGQLVTLPKPDRIQAPVILPEPETVQTPVTLPKPDQVQAPVILPEPDRVQAPVILPEPETVQTPVTLPKPDQVQTPVILPEPETIQTPVILPKPDQVQAPVILAEPETIQTPPAALLVPVTFPGVLHAYELPPQKSASIVILPVVEENLTAIKAPAVETNTATKAQLETEMTTTRSLNQTANVPLTTTNLTISYSTNVASNVTSTAGHESSPITSTSHRNTTESGNVTSASPRQPPENAPSISAWSSSTATMASTSFSSAPTQQSPATSTTAYQSPSLASSTTNQISVISSTSQPTPHTTEQVSLKTTGQAPQALFSVTEKSSLTTKPTSSLMQSLKTSSAVTHHHLVILPSTFSISKHKP